MKRGALLPAPEGSHITHIDATQAVGKVPFAVGEADYVSMSAHKIYGPKGIGALYVRDPRQIRPLITGGGQQQGHRSGTLNVPGIVGLGAICRILIEESEKDRQHYANLRAIAIDRFTRCSHLHINEHRNNAPHILSISFEGVEGETMVLELDARGYAISSGAACSAEKTKPNHVLLALNSPPEWIKGTIRISFGKYNTQESTSDMASLVVETVNRLRKMRLSPHDAT